jgi:Mrp family chromosome partitioning ATPase
VAPRTLLARVQATPVAQSNIIAIDASAHTPAEAAALANSFARQTINQRTSALHAQLQTLVPPLIRTLGQLPPGERASLSQELAVLETLQHSPDPTLTVASNAQTPTAPASPRKALSLLAGAFGGLVLGLVAAFALQALDPRLRNEEQLRNLYRLPLLARVPKQRHKAGPIAPPDAVPAAAEAFRTLRAAFTSVGPPAGPARAILVTGDSPMLGKTTVALNLAASLTAASQQVMLIEADLRKPSIGRALGVTAPYGVGNVLVDEVDLIDALIWARPYGPGLELLLADPNGPLLLDRLSLPSARKLIHEARALADYVIIDSPPLTLISDALPLAEEVDDVLIVAGLGSSVLGKLTDLGELFVHHQIRPAGMVLVGAEPDDGEGYYGRYDLVTPSSTTLFGLLQRISPNGDRVTIS